jgi:hypothetical protein
MNHENPLHGTYDAFFDGTSWSKPKLLLAPPDPAVEYEMPDDGAEDGPDEDAQTP